MQGHTLASKGFRRAKIRVINNHYKGYLHTSPWLEGRTKAREFSLSLYCFLKQTAEPRIERAEIACRDKRGPSETLVHPL